MEATGLGGLWCDNSIHCVVTYVKQNFDDFIVVHNSL